MPSSTSLDNRVAALVPEVDPTLRQDLTLAVRTLREAGNPVGVLIGMSRLSLRLVQDIFVRAGHTPPSQNLYDCIVKAASGDPSRKISGLHLLPDELASSLHTIRIHSNKPDHNDERIAFSVDDAENALRLFLRVTEWFYCEYKAGPQLLTIYDPARLEEWSRITEPARIELTLPVPPTSLVGRDRELIEVLRLLRSDDVWLVSLTGAGGSGKTRLALEVAAGLVDRFPAGIFFVDLSPVVDVNLVIPRIAHTLGIPETGDSSLLASLKEYLRDKQLLLVLDNFEQVAAASPVIADLHESSSGLKLLVTSRAPLNVRGEREYPVPPLPLPDPDCLPPLEQLAHVPAVELFLQRAKAVLPDFTLTEANAAAVAEICVRLDGLPLAIELAAVWTKTLTLDDIMAGLRRRLNFLTRGPRDLPARQRTLRKAIASSYKLLSRREKALFRWLSVFVGTWSLDGAQAIASFTGSTSAIDTAETLAGLIDHSLVETRRGADGADLRYSMLETIREFAAERLEASREVIQVWAAFERFFIDFATKAETGMRGPEQVLWLDRLEEEHDNIRAALRNAVDRGDWDVALNLAPRLWEFWRIRGYLVEGSAWLERALDLAPASAPELRAAGEYALGKLFIDLANYEAAESHFRNCADLWQARGDQQRVVEAKNALLILKLNTEEFEEGRALGEEALRIARLIDDELGSATALFNLGLIARSDGRPNEAVRLLDEALAQWRAQGNPKWIALTTQSLGITHRRLGHVELARAHFEECQDIYERLNNLFGLAIVASELGLIEEDIGHHARAIALQLEAIEHFEKVGAPLGIIESLEWIGVSAANAGQAIPALQLFGAAAAARRKLRVTLMTTEAPFINAGLETARERASTGAEDAFRSGELLTLEQAHNVALSLTAEPVLNREGNRGGSRR